MCDICQEYELYLQLYVRLLGSGVQHMILVLQNVWYETRVIKQPYQYIYVIHGCIFAVCWMYNFEIRVGKSDELGNNDICHKQIDCMDSVQANITCSRELYGNWVSINSTLTESGVSRMAFTEVRVFGMSMDVCKRKWKQSHSKLM